MIPQTTPSDGASFPGLRRRRGVPWAVLALAIAIAFLMNPVPGIGLTNAASAGPVATPPAATVAPPAPVAKATTAGPALAGTGPDTPFTPNLKQLERLTAADLAVGAPHSPTPGSAPDSTSGLPSASAPPAAAPAGDAPAPPTGTFNGYVYNQSDPSQPLSGVSVQAFPLGGGSFCNPLTVCAAKLTGVNGEFNATCPTGPSVISFTKSFFADNETYATCVVNQTTDLGNVYLDPDGIIIGTVHGDVTGHPGLGAVQVVGEARDYSVVALPGVVSTSNGSFRVPVPPEVAGRLDFTPAGTNYQNNFTWVTAGPEQTVNIGTVYLEPNSLVEAKFYDSVTGAAIDGIASLTVCSSVTSACGVQGAASESGNEVTAIGPSGYDYVLAEAAGYLENETPIGYVPGTTPGHPFCVPDNCKIFLTGTGAIRLTVDLSGTPSPRYHTGLWVAQVCSIDGYELALAKLNPATYTYNTSLTDCVDTCAPVGATVNAGALPMRNDVLLFPDSTGICFPPTPTWPIPGDLPVWGNESAANVTPD
jgi:hypothetical protein